ncbi:MAG: oxidoreductase [Actinomycetales bacterium]|nr:oxidoreductase [Actinomycetales bacterium]
MSATEVSVLLIGFGLGGRVFHAPLIEAVPSLRLDGIVTGNPERAEQARTAHPEATIHPTVEEALAHPYDLAVISTANATHVPYATAALGAGMHVVLDKPIAPTAAAATELALLATDRGRLLIPFQNRRWDSDFLTALQVARDGRIGTVHRYESRIERMRVTPKPGWRGSADPADMGGMLYDLGAHVIDQAILLMGPVTSVSAAVRSVRPDFAADDDVVLLLTHLAGGVSVLTVSQIAAFPEPRITLFGTHGGLRVDATDSQEPALVAGRDPRSAEWGREPAGTDAYLRTMGEDNVAHEELLPLVAGQWPRFYRAVAETLTEGAVPPVLVSDVIQNLRVLDAARTSAATGTVVTLDPPAGHEE